jgi:hypothetical protein
MGRSDAIDAIGTIRITTPHHATITNTRSSTR